MVRSEIKTGVLTERQLEVLLRYIQHVVKFGYPPTMRELMTELDIRSTNGVRGHLAALERKGYLINTGGGARTLSPVHPKVTAAICTGVLNDLIQHVPDIEATVKALEAQFVVAFA
tara:strand:- start:6 stop:353 length:348 start_codon:yes stop_codon:yes gene_type:complete